jgi:monoamine oxidase
VKIAVVGAGLAGLACAVDVARAGVDVTVFEARNRVGGRIWSDVMPDGARFERGGEFIEAGYEHVRRRAAEYDLSLVPQGFAFAAREVRSGGQRLPTLLLEAERVLAATVEALGTDAAGTSAAEALARTPLEPLVRQALHRRLEGTYTVELERVSASWLSSVDLRAAGAEEASARLADGNDALAKAMASELGERVRLGRAIRDCNVEDCDRVVLAVPLPIALDELLPGLRERGSYERLQWGVAAKLHVRLGAPAPARAVQALGAAFWTWTASGPGGAPSTVAASFAGGRDALESLAIRIGCERWRAALQGLRPELALSGNAVLTDWWNDPWCRGSYACHPPGWSQRDDEAVAAPYGRIHLAGEHTAAEFCGTMEGALRSGARAAAEVLASIRTSG